MIAECVVPSPGRAFAAFGFEAPPPEAAEDPARRSLLQIASGLARGSLVLFAGGVLLAEVDSGTSESWFDAVQAIRGGPKTSA